MKNGAYSLGKVSNVRDFKCSVYTFDLRETILRDLDDPTAMILFLHPKHSQVRRGTRVIALKSKGNQ